MKKIFNTFTEICEPLTFLILTDYGNFVCQSILSVCYLQKKISVQICVFIQ